MRPGGQGYAPGLNAEDVIVPPAHGFQALAVNGMRIVAERTVFFGWGDFDLICPACKHRFEYKGDSTTSPLPGWDKAVDEWCAGTGSGLLACPECARATPVTGWGYDPPWAFGCLGFEFWNWPSLRAEFVADVAACLGHRVVVVCGKL